MGCSPSIDLVTNWADSRWNQFLAEDQVCSIIKTIFKKIDFSHPVEISLSFVNDQEIRHLNALHRGKDQPTNVLSFPSFDRDFWQEKNYHLFPLLTVGDVVLSFDTLEKEAQDQGKLFFNHAAHLITHGVLHLFGYDHVCESEAIEMETLERLILNDLGIHDPYEEKEE